MHSIVKTVLIITSVLAIAESIDFCTEYVNNGYKIDFGVEDITRKPDIYRYLFIGNNSWEVTYNDITKQLELSRDVIYIVDFGTKYQMSFIYMDQNSYNWTAFYSNVRDMIDVSTVNTSQIIRSKISNVWLNSDFKPSVAFGPSGSSDIKQNSVVFAIQQTNPNKVLIYSREVRAYVFENALTDQTSKLIDKIPQFVNKIANKFRIVAIFPFYEYPFKYAVILQNPEYSGLSYCMTYPNMNKDECSEVNIKFLKKCYFLTTTPITTSLLTTKTSTSTSKPMTESTTTTTTSQSGLNPSISFKQDFPIFVIIGLATFLIVLFFAVLFVIFMGKKMRYTGYPNKDLSLDNASKLNSSESIITVDSETGRPMNALRSDPETE